MSRARTWAGPRGQVAQAIAAAGEPPRGVRVEPMGQLPPMIEMFQALGIGLAVAVFVIFVLLTAYFQSPRMALISIGAVPGVLAGIATILYFTNTSLNIESFMGSIMSLGVSVSNSVLLVTFMNEHWKGGASSTEAADRRRGRAAAADPDDRLCDDRGHGADGAGAGAREPDAGPARPGGDRRAGDVDVCHLAGAPVDLRGRDRQEGGPVAVDLPGRPREPALRPARLRRRGHQATTSSPPPMTWSAITPSTSSGIPQEHPPRDPIERHDMVTHHSLDDLLDPRITRTVRPARTATPRTAARSVGVGPARPRTFPTHTEIPDAPHPLTQKTLLHFELGKASGRLRASTAPLPGDP